jgi:hypothetical protein
MRGLRSGCAARVVTGKNAFRVGSEARLRSGRSTWFTVEPEQAHLAVSLDEILR